MKQSPKIYMCSWAVIPDFMMKQTMTVGGGAGRACGMCERAANQWSAQKEHAWEIVDVRKWTRKRVPVTGHRQGVISGVCGHDTVTSSRMIPPSSGSEVMESDGTEMKMAWTSTTTTDAPERERREGESWNMCPANDVLKSNLS